MRKALLASCILLLAATGSAQDATEPSDEVATATPRPHLQVLEHPYDLASFYRAGSHGFGPPARLGPIEGPYGLAAYYRGDQSPFGYSRFWTLGEAVHPEGVLGYRRPPGHNGEVFLLAPTLLAPFGTLADVFYGRGEIGSRVRIRSEQPAAARRER